MKGGPEAGFIAPTNAISPEVDSFSKRETVTSPKTRVEFNSPPIAFPPAILEKSDTKRLAKVREALSKIIASSVAASREIGGTGEAAGGLLGGTDHITGRLL